LTIGELLNYRSYPIKSLKEEVVKKPEIIKEQEPPNSDFIKNTY